MARKSQRRGPIVVVLAAVAMATVAVVGLVPAEAQNPRCDALVATFNQSTDPTVRQFILAQLAASGCTLPGGTTTSTTAATTSTTRATTTSTTSSTTTTTRPPTTTTSINPQNILCATLGRILSVTNDPTVRAFIVARLVQSGCPVPGGGTA